MKVTYTVQFSDHSIAAIEIEKPAGAASDSSLALITAINEAELSGKFVDLIVMDNLINSKYIEKCFELCSLTRQEVFDSYIQSTTYSLERIL